MCAFIHCYFSGLLNRYILFIWHMTITWPEFENEFIFRKKKLDLKFFDVSASLSVADGIYSSNWYAGSIKYKKMVLNVISFAPKGRTLTALNFTDMTLETFQWVMIFMSFLT
jgi:hypothetical protein